MSSTSSQSHREVRNLYASVEVSYAENSVAVGF